LPAAVVNFDEFIKWAGQAGFTGLVSIVAGGLTANILWAYGEFAGAGVVLEYTLRKEMDEALALLYAPGATVEVYVAD